MPTTAYVLILLAALVATAAALVILDAAERRRSVTTLRPPEEPVVAVNPSTLGSGLERRVQTDTMFAVRTRTAYLAERVTIAVSELDYRWLRMYAIHSLTIRNELAPAVVTTLTHLLTATSDPADTIADHDTSTPPDTSRHLVLARVDADDICSWLRNAQQVTEQGFSPYAVGNETDVHQARRIADHLLDTLYPQQSDQTRDMQIERSARSISRELSEQG